MLFTILLACVALVDPIGASIYQSSCGIPEKTVLLLHGGTPTTSGEWPWHVAIFHTINKLASYACGGSIINKKTILTAAHCVFFSYQQLREAEISVRVGQVNLNETTKHLQVYNVSQIIIYPEFNVFVGVDHDIALMILSSDITMTRFVQPVCLWASGDDLFPIVNRNGTVVGFGVNENDEHTGQLQHGTLTVVNTTTCLANDRLVHGQVLTNNMFCAGAKDGISPCNGDSGGGMVFEKDGAWYIRGIISFIAKRPLTTFCDPSKYTVFTDVSKYIDWIVETIDTPDYLAQLKPCEKGFVSMDAVCNVANLVDDRFLLISWNYTIVRVAFNGTQNITNAIEREANSFDHDCVDDRIYWTAFNKMPILSSKYDGTDEKPFITEDIDDPHGVAVDWISRRIYWTDLPQKTIEVASLDNPNVRTVLIAFKYYPLFLLNLAVDPLRSKLYWSAILGTERRIEWSNLDGTDRQLLLESPRLREPEQMAVHLSTGELCYTESKAGKIECIDPKSKRTRSIVSNLLEPYGLAITSGMFYSTDSATKNLLSIDTQGTTETLFEFPYESPKMITAVTDKCPFYTSPCAVSNGDCPENTICLVNPSAPAGKNCTIMRYKADAERVDVK